MNDLIPVNLGTFIVGMQPEITIDVFTAAGELTAPTTLQVITRDPAGTETVYELGTDAEITTLAAGQYKFTHPRLAATDEGAWLGRTNSGGATTTTAQLWTFTVPNDPFTTPLP
jgi:hypothetical protein